MGDKNDGKSEKVKTPMLWKWNDDSLVKDNRGKVGYGNHILTQYDRVPIVLSMKSEHERTLHG